MNSADPHPPIQLRPRRATELIDVSFQLWRRTFRSLRNFTMTVAAPFSALAAATAYKSTEATRSQRGSNAFGVALGPLSILTVFLLSLALIPVLHNALVGGSQTVGESVRYGLRQTPKAVIYTLLSIIAFFALSLVGLGVFGAAFAAIFVVARAGGVIVVVVVIILGMVLYIVLLVTMLGLGSRFQVGAVALVVEKVRPMEALRRGFRLTKKRWLAFGATQAVVLVLSYLLIGIPTAIALSVASDSASQPTFAAIAAFLVSLIYILWWIPMYTGLGVSMYVDARVRVEAIDLDSLSGQLSNSWSPTTLS